MINRILLALTIFIINMNIFAYDNAKDQYKQRYGRLGFDAKSEITSITKELTVTKIVFPLLVHIRNDLKNIENDYFVGDEVYGYKLVEIRKDSIVLRQKGGKIYELNYYETDLIKSVIDKRENMSKDDVQIEKELTKKVTFSNDSLVNVKTLLKVKTVDMTKKVEKEKIDTSEIDKIDEIDRETDKKLNEKIEDDTKEVQDSILTDEEKRVNEMLKKQKELEKKEAEEKLKNGIKTRIFKDLGENRLDSLLDNAGAILNKK